MYKRRHGVTPHTVKSRLSDVDYRFVAHLIGLLLAFQSLLLASCCGVSWQYGEGDWVSFAAACGVCACAAIMLLVYGRRKPSAPSRYEAYVVVALSYVFFTVFGMLPYLIGGYVEHLSDAFFETMSGFTTTGATILDAPEQLPHGLLLWRSLTQWIGGLGIVCFTIVLLPGFGASSRALYLSEATGVTPGKLLAKTRVMARYVFGVYVVLTLADCVLLKWGGMGLFDAVCHSMATTSTGGFSTRADSLAHMHSAYIEYVTAIFMLLSAVNFSLYVAAIKWRWKQPVRNAELKWFVCSVCLLTLIVAAVLCVSGGCYIETAFRKSFFQVASFHTSCGFVTSDYTLWPPLTWMVLIFAGIAGGCTGSTSGGIKMFRLIIIAKCIAGQFRQALHPSAVLPVRAGSVIDGKLAMGVLVFFAAYVSIAFVGTALLSAFGVGFAESATTVLSAMGNGGPSFGCFGPTVSWAAMPDAAKYTLSALMLIGRLEIFGFLLLFYRSTWKGSWS